jgi:hypothetical protein
VPVWCTSTCACACAWADALTLTDCAPPHWLPRACLQVAFLTSLPALQTLSRSYLQSLAHCFHQTVRPRAALDPAPLPSAISGKRAATPGGQRRHGSVAAPARPTAGAAPPRPAPPAIRIHPAPSCCLPPPLPAPAAPLPRPTPTPSSQEFEPRELVVRQGDAADSMYVIRSGQVCVPPRRADAASAEGSASCTRALAASCPRDSNVAPRLSALLEGGA